MKTIVKFQDVTDCRGRNWSVGFTSIALPATDHFKDPDWVLGEEMSISNDSTESINVHDPERNNRIVTEVRGNDSRRFMRTRNWGWIAVG